MKVLKTALLVVVAVVVFAAIGVYSGVFNFAADDPHWGITQRLIETARIRSIANHADDISVPTNLADEKVIASGAGEYAEMCTGCHLAPGMKDTEMRTGLYPKPPNLSGAGEHPYPAHQFWIIKHGLKMTGMPAWGLTHDDERIWSMVAFLQKLPKLTPAAYQELIESGEGGHSHGDMEHDDAPATASTDEKGHEHSDTESQADARPEKRRLRNLTIMPPTAMRQSPPRPSYLRAT